MYLMLTRLGYIGLLLLSLPALFFGYVIVSNLPNRFNGTDELEQYIAVALGVALAITAVYGLITGKPFSALPKPVQWLIIAAGAVASIVAVIFAVMVSIALSWR